MRAKDLTLNINCHLIRDDKKSRFQFKIKYSEEEMKTIFFFFAAISAPASQTS